MASNVLRFPIQFANDDGDDPRPGGPSNVIPFPGRQITPAMRAAIEIHIENMIALLDTADGDPDIEDDDPAGDPLGRGEEEDWRPNGIVLSRPVYGADQSRGPVNERQVANEYYRAMERAA